MTIDDAKTALPLPALLHGKFSSRNGTPGVRLVHLASVREMLEANRE